MAEPFERGVVVVSIDTEQIWGYRDLLSEAQFEGRFPNAPEAHPKLLAHLSEAGISATWFVVGALALCDKAPRGSEASAKLWCCRTFLERLRDARPTQEIGLHGGLTHLIWTDERSNRDVVRRELSDGIQALAELRVQPRSFSYPRNQEAFHDLLPQHGIQCFRGAPPTLAWQLGRTIPGAIVRALDELRRSTPPVGWPREVNPGFWSIPASMFLYPLQPVRTRLVGLSSRVKRFTRGLEAAARHHAIFHFCFHPENLTESPHGFHVLDDILENLVRSRNRGDIEVLTMSDVAARVKRKEVYA
jgi:peptidoglycan/xylan/chitin deacetylase (PgdA/CDA1 family)